jgi:hypothetical protein
MRAINCSSLKLKRGFSLWSIWLVFDCYQIVALKDAVHHRGKEIIALGSTPPLCPSRGVFKETARRSDSN